MRSFRIDLAYDGTDFSGWQIQPVAHTIQGALIDALERVLGKRPRLFGASRTDAGVHARGQVASFEAETRLEADVLERALNSMTPGDIVVTALREAAPGFHARFQATGKRYRYRIRAGGPGSPFDRRFAWQLRRPLDVPRMAAEATALLGEHDFSSFRAAGCSAATPVRRLDVLEISAEGPVIEVLVVGPGFLRHMVRNIVGTLVEAGRSRIPEGGVLSVLEARDRSCAGPTAPARGLCLEEVFYADHEPAKGRHT